MKLCRDCKIKKSEHEFIKNKAFSTGLDTLCKECNRKRVLLWRQKNPEKRKLQQQRETQQSIASGKNALNQAKYKYHKIQATPKISSEDDLWFIEEIYHLAELRTKLTGIKWHVDHIVPLQHPTACGLHVWNNLQVIPAKLNYGKRNYNFNEYSHKNW